MNVTSLVERVSRYAVVMRKEDRQYKPIMESLIQGLGPLPADARQSITFDRGTVFSTWRYLKVGIGADVRLFHSSQWGLGLPVLRWPLRRSVYHNEIIAFRPTSNKNSAVFVRAIKFTGRFE
jgi:hypothetical protein